MSIVINPELGSPWIQAVSHEVSSHSSAWICPGLLFGLSLSISTGTCLLCFCGVQVQRVPRSRGVFEHLSIHALTRTSASHIFLKA